MLCQDLLKLKGICEHVKLLSGQGGLDNRIRWIYFADGLNCDESHNWTNWIHGGELVIMTNKDFIEDTPSLLSLIREFHNKKISGFLMNIGQAKPEVMALCEDLSLPLFEINWDLRLVDFSQTLCMALTEEIRRDTSRSQLISAILYHSASSEKSLIEQAGLLHLDLTRPHYAAALTPDTPLDETRFFNFVENTLYSLGIATPMLTHYKHCVLLFLPADTFSYKKTDQLLHAVQDNAKISLGTTVSAGLGSTYPHLSQFRQSADEAVQALHFIHCEKKTSWILSYQDGGLYYLISQIPDPAALTFYVNRMLGPLLEADAASGSFLCDTLACYLDFGGNSTKTAQSLFIHRNTLAYRLNKIKELLPGNLKDSLFLSELQIALKVRKYLEITS